MRLRRWSDSPRAGGQGTPGAGDLEAVERVAEAYRLLLEQVHKVIVGQDAVVRDLVTTLFAGGHCILEGVPGLAKTLLVRTVAEILDLRFSRIQFTPDLMPSDITGTDIFEEDAATGRRSFKFIRGPVFANVVLADEINRTPPKTQAALLQAMQERQVTAGGETHTLEPPFFVLATQNPIELEGTYPLPEAQLDRFMFNIMIDYPNVEQEVEIATTTTSAYQAELKKVMGAREIIDLQGLVRRVPVARNVAEYAVRLARATRPGDETSLQFVRDWVSWGVGPRASQFLLLGAKTRAILDGRPSPEIDDVKDVSLPVLRHRLVTNFNAEAEGVRTPEIVRRLLAEVPASA
jgi:MoxR-like ATPase